MIKGISRFIDVGRAGRLAAFEWMCGQRKEKGLKSTSSHRRSTEHAGWTERTVLSQVMVIVSLTMSKTTLVKYGSQARFCSKHFSRVGKKMTAMRMRLNGSCWWANVYDMQRLVCIIPTLSRTDAFQRSSSKAHWPRVPSSKACISSSEKVAWPASVPHWLLEHGQSRSSS